VSSSDPGKKGRWFNGVPAFSSSLECLAPQIHPTLRLKWTRLTSIQASKTFLESMISPLPERRCGSTLNYRPPPAWLLGPPLEAGGSTRAGTIVQLHAQLSYVTAWNWLNASAKDQPARVSLEFCAAGAERVCSLSGSHSVKLGSSSLVDSRISEQPCK